MTAVSARDAPERQGTGQAGRGLPLWLLLGVGLAGGLLAALAFPPYRLPGLGVVGVAGAMWSLLRAASARRGAACGFAWGVGFGAVLFQWALALELVAYLALVPIQAAFWAVGGALAGALARRGVDGWWVAGAAAAWTLAEALRARWPFGGFEWGQLGLSFADLPVRSGAALLGTLGLTALAAALAAALALTAHRPRRWRPLLAAALTMGAVTALGALEWTSPDGSLDVAVVQIDDPCPGDFAVDCPDFRELLLERHVEGTERLDTDPDLLLWGEGTLRGDSPEEAGAMAADALDGLPAPLLSGVANPVAPGRFAQRNVLYDVDADVRGVYDKRHPVPFGEYVPFRSVLGRVGDVGRYVPNDIVRGERAVAMGVPVEGQEVDLGTVVSWEVTFSREVRDAAQLGAAVATLTTQASYGPDQPVSDQLLGAAQLRAAESQKAMVIAATTGRSAIVLPTGELLSPTSLFAADTLTGELPLRDGATPFQRWGELPVMALTAGTLVAVGLRVRRDSDGAA